MSGTPVTSNLANETVSSNGDNVRPKLMPTSHFYIEDGNGAFAQTSGQAFGPVSTTQFRTTSNVTFTGNKKVYAICQGQIFVQPHASDATKVNVVLKPFKQPINEIPIKYFVYRGLNKSDFITSGGTPEIAGSETTGTELNQFLWAQFNNFFSMDNSGLPVPSFVAKYIGYPSGPLTQNVADKIDEYFFKKTVYTDATNTVETVETAYEMPIVPRGIELGTATGEIGIDVVLNNGDFDYIGGIHPFVYDLNFARSADHVLDTANGTTPYEEKLIREACINFLDIAAFYGLHASNEGKLYVDASTTAIETMTGIFGVMTNFFTKDRQYLHIKGNRQRSYNFYGEHEHPDDTNSNTIAIGDNVGTLAETTYGTDGWPIHILTNKATQTLQLMVSKVQLSAYVKVGILETENNNNFLSKDSLVQGGYFETIMTDENYTQPITLLYNQDNGVAIASYTEIIYDGALSTATESGGTDIYPVKSIDGVFDLVNVVPFVKAFSDTDMPVAVGQDLQLFSFKDNSEDFTVGAVKVKKTFDKLLDENSTYVNRVLYETQLEDVETGSFRSYRAVSTTVESSVAKTRFNEPSANNYYEPSLEYSFKQDWFYYEQEWVTGLRLVHRFDDIPSKRGVGLTEAENQVLTDLAVNNNLNNVRLFFYTDKSTSARLVSQQGVNYMIYELMITAEESTGSLGLFKPTEPVQVISLDGNLFYSIDYAKHLPNKIQTLNSPKKP